jgi:hypothetical protein
MWTTSLYDMTFLNIYFRSVSNLNYKSLGTPKCVERWRHHIENNIVNAFSRDKRYTCTTIGSSTCAVKDVFTTNYNFNIQIVEILQKVLANAEQVWRRTEFHSPSSYTKLESAGQFQDPLHPHLYQCVQIDMIVLLHTSIFSCRINNRSNYIQQDRDVEHWMINSFPTIYAGRDKHQDWDCCCPFKKSLQSFCHTFWSARAALSDAFASLISSSCWEKFD